MGVDMPVPGVEISAVGNRRCFHRTAAGSERLEGIRLLGTFRGEMGLGVALLFDRD